MKKKTIAVLLPFKDHFTNSKAGSASIWVKDFNKKSIYKKQIVIFGNTNNFNDLIDKRNYKVDFSKVKKVLNFEANFSIDDGIDEIINYYGFKKLILCLILYTFIIILIILY